MSQQATPLALAPSNGRGLQLTSLDDVLKFAGIVIKSGLAPKSFDTPEKVVLAIVQGSELGISAMQSLQGLSVVSGRIGIMGDLALALCQADPSFEDYTEDWLGAEGEDGWGCQVTVKRRGRSPQVRKFTVADAKTAGLWGKRSFKGEPTPWVTYPKRMLRYRALGFTLRDAFPDVLKGIKTTEELEDYPEEAKRGFEHAKPVLDARVTDAPTNGNGAHHEGPSNGNGNDHAEPEAEVVTLKGLVSAYEARASNGQIFHGALVGEARVVTTELGHTLKQLGGLEVAVLAVPSKKPGVYHLRAIQSVTSPNGEVKRPADKSSDEATPAERTPWEEVQRQLTETNIAEHWVVKAAQRLEFIPSGVQRLSDLNEAQLRVLLVRFSDLVTAARQEEQGVEQQAAA